MELGKKVTNKVVSMFGTIHEFSEPVKVQNKARFIFRGDFLKKNIFKENVGLLVTFFIMLIIYVGLRYFVEHDIKEIARLQKELDEVRIESITRSSELMKASKRSSVVKSVKEKGIGLHESNQPPLLIK